jgi:mannose-6-phosphate isomerase-like protein (cupin superfamily)
VKYKIIKPAHVEEKNLGAIAVQNLFFDKHMNNLSVAKVTLTGEQTFGYNKESDVAYYVLQGRGKFHFETKTESVKKGDLIFIPKNTKYKDSGKLTLLAIATPKFDGKKRVHIKE